MCGIAGWNLTEKPSLAFVLTLAAQIEERGRDSFGFYNGETKEVYKAKDAITARMRADRLQFLHGFFHTRHATTGAKSVENSHPYQIGDVLGAHNGVIHNDKAMDLKYNRNFAVDSMHIFAHISEGLATDELEGYGAIEYIRDGKYYVAATNHGSLEVALTDKGVVWASTSESIDAAICQAGYTLKHYYRIDQGSVYRVEPDAMYDTEHTFKMREHVYPKYTPAPAYFPSAKTGIIGDSSTMNQWERDLEREERLYEISAFHSDPDMPIPDGSPEFTHDWCHWCGKFAEVASMDDGSLGCLECIDLFDEMEDEDADKSEPEADLPF